MARYFLPASLLSELVLKMTSAGYNLYLQQGAGNYEDSEESELSQQSEDSPKTAKKRILFKKETALLNPWSLILDETEQRHGDQLNALIHEDEGNGDSENVARVKAENALDPVYGKELRKVL